MQFSIDRFNHSASICAAKNNILITFYSASKECADDEQVNLLLLKDETVVDSTVVDKKVGNSIVFCHNDKPYILYSRFRTPFNKFNAIDRWQNTILLYKEVKLAGLFSPKKLKLSSRFALSNTRLLPRCNPLIEKDRTILPLYQEGDRSGNLVFGLFKPESDNKLEILSTKANKPDPVMIQPTIWKDKYGTYNCLSRNFNPRKYGPWAWYCKSTDLIKWSNPILIRSLTNCNNSCYVFGNEHKYIIYNNDERGRNNLTLAKLDVCLRPHEVYNFGPGSYPNAIIHNDKFHIVYTVKVSDMKTEIVYIIKDIPV